MRTLLLEGFGRQIALFLLVAVTLGGASASILSFGVEQYFHGAVSGIAGAPGAYDLIVHLRHDAGDEALRVLYDRLTHLSPDITWQRTTDLGGYINVLVALPQNFHNQNHINALDNLLHEVPAYAGSTWVISPSITIRDVHPGLKETLSAIVQSRPEVNFVFERGDTIWAVLRSPQAVPAVETYLKNSVRQLRVAELFPLDVSENEVDIALIKEQAQELLVNHFPSFVVRDLGPLTSSDDEISALRTIRNFLTEIAPDNGNPTNISSKPPTWWQLLVEMIHDFLQRVGLGGLAQGLVDTPGPDRSTIPHWIGPETSTRLIHAIDTLLSQTPVQHGPIHFLLQGDGVVSPDTMDRIADKIDPSVGWLVRDGGVVEPDPRTTLMMLIENARRVVVIVFATLMTAVIFFFDVSTLVSFCRQLDQDAGRSPLDIAYRAAFNAGVLCMGLMAGIAAFGGAMGGWLSLWMVMAVGFLLGVALSFLALKISPIDEDQYVGAISLGVPEVMVLKEVILPAARPGLLYWWGRVRRNLLAQVSWSTPKTKAVER